MTPVGNVKASRSVGISSPPRMGWGIDLFPPPAAIMIVNHLMSHDQSFLILVLCNYPELPAMSSKSAFASCKSFVSNPSVNPLIPMTYCIPYKAKLQRHPTTPAQAVRSVEVQVSWENGEAFALTFALTGDLARLRIPAPQPPHRADNLWRHTCFEAFFRYKGEQAYCEFNFAPSGEWAAYAFCNYRDGMSLVQDLDPRIVARRTEERLELEGGCMSAQ